MPDNPTHSRRRFRNFILIGLLVLVGIVVAAIMGRYFLGVGIPAMKYAGRTSSVKPITITLVDERTGSELSFRIPKSNVA